MRKYRDNLFRELIVDNFAGGGGASVGIELATGRPVDIAVNHDPDAIAMHQVNHPYTQHYQEDVFAIDPVKVTGGRPVGIAWYSPDCKHFSRAKGGKPVEKKIRGLSWVVLKWALSAVAPRVFFMENVPEIQTWGPLKEVNGALRPDPMREGETFKGFVAMLTTGIERAHPAFLEACEFLHLDPDGAEAKRLICGLGYAVSFKVLKACDYGAPTIRKRFYLIARNDGQPIVFPKPTHGKGKGLKPYRNAAECIDWTLPCSSIFGRKKDLAVNTQRRIARGLDKFVIKNPQPFIMQMNFENAPQDIGKPLSTETAVNKHYVAEPVIQPYIMSNNTNNAPHSVGEPLPTITTGNRNFLCVPTLVGISQTGGGDRVQSVKNPLRTICTKNEHIVSMAYLTKYFSGEKQKGADITEPLPSVTAVDHNAAVVVHLSSRYGDGKDGRGSHVDEPAPTVTGTNHSHIVAANIVHYYGGADHASRADGPLPTITATPRHYLIESHLCILRNNMDCKLMTEPFPTVTAHAGHEVQVTTYLQKIEGVQDLGNWVKVRKLLNEYAGYTIADDEILILEINKVPYFIADVGMRMLKARELMLAQGFPPDYIIDIERHIGKKYSEAKQIARIGNSVCPPVATALVRANCAEMAFKRPLRTVADLDRAIASA